MSTNEDVLVKLLPSARPTGTAQAFVFSESEPPDLLVTYEKGDAVINAKGKQEGKHQGFALPGGKIETLFNIYLQDGTRYVHKDPKNVDKELFIERDLVFLLKRRPLELEGELIDNNRALSALLKKYCLDEPVNPIKLLLKTSRINNGKDGEIEFLTLVPVRDETPDETVCREIKSETGFDTEIVYYKVAWNVNIRDYQPPRFGEIIYEEKPDKLKRKDVLGRPIPHCHYTFNLEVTGGTLKIDENDEVEWAGWANLKSILEKVYNELDARYNRGGVYLQHGTRIFNCLNIMMGSEEWKKYAPENVQEMWDKAEAKEAAMVAGAARISDAAREKKDAAGANAVDAVDEDDFDYEQELLERYALVVAKKAQSGDDKWSEWGESLAAGK